MLFNPHTGNTRHPSDIQSDPGGILIWNGGTQLKSAPMAQSLAERQRNFKAAMKAAGYVKLEAWVTKEQREQFRQLGGDAWLRRKIKAAANLKKLTNGA